MSQDRKRLLQQKLGELRRRLVRKNAEDGARELLKALEREGIAYRMTVDFEKPLPARSCLDRHFSVTSWGTLACGGCEIYLEKPWLKIEDLASSFANAVAKYAPEDREIWVTWFSPVMPSFCLKVSDFFKVSSFAFELSYDTWIIETTGRWCFLAYHENLYYFGLNKSRSASIGRDHA